MLTGLTLPLSTVLGCTVFPLGIGVVWLVSGQFMKLPFLLRQNPVAACCAGMFLWLVFATLYSESDSNGAISSLKKYRELALVPVFIGILTVAKNRRRVLHMSIIGMGLALLVSFAQAGEVLPLYRGQAAPSSYITHGTLMAWLIFWLLHEARRRGTWLPWVGVILAGINVFVIIDSSTWTVLLLACIILFIWQTLPLRSAVSALFGVLILVLVVFSFSENFQDLIKADLQEWQRADKNVPGKGGGDQRLEFWRNTIDIIRKSPVFGHGMGSYPGQYNRVVSDMNLTATTNPHNEYLMLWAQAGVPAVALLLLIFIFQWRQSRGPERFLGQGFVVLFAIGCVFNSFILDSREGMLFALMTAVLYPSPLECPKRGFSDRSNEY